MTESRTLCVNHHRYFHRFRIKQIDTPIDLLAWLKAHGDLPKMFWHGRDGIEVAAAGSALTLHNVPHFDDANDSPAHFWGGHAFFPSDPPKDDLWKGFPRCLFFIPKYEIIRKGNTTTLVEHAINAPLGEELPLSSNYFSSNNYSFAEAFHLPVSEKWDELIEGSLGKIREKVFDKVVMARRSTHHSKEPLDPFRLLAEKNSQNGIRFAIQFTEDSTFIGVTPERLYMREGRNLYTEAVAGTCPIDQGEDSLLNSAKDRHEFEFVKTSIKKALSPLCSSLTCQDEDKTLQARNVYHLYNPFAGILNPSVYDDEILKALHPTAAMGGLPKSEALKHLQEFEPFERGWYASPIGYISQDKAEFAVAIRSALIEREKIHLFAGTGIVEGSCPKKEWEELNAKTALWRN